MVQGTLPTPTPTPTPGAQTSPAPSATQGPPPTTAPQASTAVTPSAGLGELGVSSVPEQWPGPQLTAPYSVAVDAAGNVFVADTSNHRVRKLTPTGQLTTLAGDGTPGFADGPGATARFTNPQGVAVDTAGNLYVADAGNHRIRKISAAGVVSTLAGEGSPAFSDGPGATARFSTPVGVAVDGAGNLYVADRDNHRVRVVDPLGVVTTLAGTGSVGFSNGPGAGALFSRPQGIAVDATGTVYVVEEGSPVLRVLRRR